jgi:hypothetical protein
VSGVLGNFGIKVDAKVRVKTGPISLISWRFNMKERIVHQWRDWLLKYINNGEYELIKKDNLSVQTITARNDMDAETQSQFIIKNLKKGQGSELPSSVES